MTLEVELKFRVDDTKLLKAKLVEFGSKQLPTNRQVDTYFAHPARNFAETDEALRLRTVEEATDQGRTNQQVHVTYKGPRIGNGAKTRREIELPLPQSDSSHADWSELLGALGFSVVREVAKTRTSYHLECDGRAMEVVIDEVLDLGTFAEVETISESGDLAAAEKTVLQIASTLGLSDPEPRSYLEMLLEL